MKGTSPAGAGKEGVLGGAPGRSVLGRRSRGKQTKAGLRGARDTLGPSIHLKEGGPKDAEVRS